jgi:hypothetical protein
VSKNELNFKVVLVLRDKQQSPIEVQIGVAKREKKEKSPIYDGTFL